MCVRWVSPQEQLKDFLFFMPVTSYVLKCILSILFSLLLFLLALVLLLSPFFPFFFLRCKAILAILPFFLTERTFFSLLLLLLSLLLLSLRFSLSLMWRSTPLQSLISAYFSFCVCVLPCFAFLIRCNVVAVFFFSVCLFLPRFAHFFIAFLLRWRWSCRRSCGAQVSFLPPNRVFSFFFSLVSALFFCVFFFLSIIADWTIRDTTFSIFALLFFIQSSIRPDLSLSLHLFLLLLRQWEYVLLSWSTFDSLSFLFFFLLCVCAAIEFLMRVDSLTLFLPFSATFVCYFVNKKNALFY